MKAETIRFIYLVFFFLELGWETFISFLNIRRIRKNVSHVPPEFAGVVDEATYRKAAVYNLDRGRFSILGGLFSSLVVLLMIFSGALGWLDAAFRGLDIHPYLRGILYIYTAALIFYLFALPFSLYSHFVIEERYGFNKMTNGLFALDAVKGLVISALISAPLLWVLFLFMDASGSLWWLWAFIFTAVFQIFINLLYPFVIAPLFNKFTPLEEGALKDRIIRLAESLSFNIKGILLWTDPAGRTIPTRILPDWVP